VVGDGTLPPPPPLRRFLRAERRAHQDYPLGLILNAAALRLVLRRLSAEHPALLVSAFHDDVFDVCAPTDMGTFLTDAAGMGTAIDTELAPAKCVGWCPSGAPPPPGWAASWVTERMTQFSIPLGSPAYVRAGVEARVEEQRQLTSAIVALPPSALQSQLLLLRLCAGPRANFRLRGLPLEARARLTAAVDADAAGVLRCVLADSRSDAGVVFAFLDRSSLPLPMEGMGIGGRMRVVAPAALESWTDALRAWVTYSPVLRAL